MFISKIISNQIHGDHYYYIAVRSKRGGRHYVWRRVPLIPGPDQAVAAGDVPEAIRERAYDLFERDRLELRS